MKDGQVATKRQLEIIIKMLNTPGIKYIAVVICCLVFSPA